MKFLGLLIASLSVMVTGEISIAEDILTSTISYSLDGSTLTYLEIGGEDWLASITQGSAPEAELFLQVTDTTTVVKYQVDCEGLGVTALWTGGAAAYLLDKVDVEVYDCGDSEPTSASDCDTEINSFDWATAKTAWSQCGVDYSVTRGDTGPYYMILIKYIGGSRRELQQLDHQMLRHLALGGDYSVDIKARSATPTLDAAFSETIEIDTDAGTVTFGDTVLTTADAGIDVFVKVDDSSVGYTYTFDCSIAAFAVEEEIRKGYLAELDVKVYDCGGTDPDGSSENCSPKTELDFVWTTAIETLQSCGVPYEIARPSGTGPYYMISVDRSAESAGRRELGQENIRRLSSVSVGTLSGAQKTAPSSSGGGATSGSRNAPGCFSKMSTVEVLGKGPMPISGLTAGDQVLTSDNVFEPILGFLHYDPTFKAQEFLQFFVEGQDTPLEATAKHLLFKEGSANPVAAESFKSGDYMVTMNGPRMIQKIDAVERDGVFAPWTPSGKVVVDNVKASTYISLQQEPGQGVEFAEFQNGMILPISQHTGIHMFASPFRMLCLNVPSLCSTGEEGMMSWTSYGIKLASFVEQQTAFVQFLVMVGMLALFVPIYGMELVFGAGLAPFVVAAFFAGCAIKKTLGLGIKTKIA